MTYEWNRKLKPGVQVVLEQILAIRMWEAALQVYLTSLSQYFFEIEAPIRAICE